MTDAKECPHRVGEFQTAFATYQPPIPCMFCAQDELRLQLDAARAELAAETKARMSVERIASDLERELHGCREALAAQTKRAEEAEARADDLQETGDKAIDIMMSRHDQELKDAHANGRRECERDIATLRETLESLVEAIRKRFADLMTGEVYEEPYYRALEALVAISATPRGEEKTFEQAFAETGYQYGPDALEQVRLGWDLHASAISGIASRSQMLAGLDGGERQPRSKPVERRDGGERPALTSPDPREPPRRTGK